MSLQKTKIHNPPHTGLTMKEDILPSLHMTVTEASEQLGVTRAALSRELMAKPGSPLKWRFG